ncbi:MAG: chromate efflux transporter [Verrucomicrobia bacterium]|nr:chromate efflux transporter [Cytophagales bacterium]
MKPDKENNPQTAIPPISIRRIRYLIFLKDIGLLSVTCFGGPQAHIAMFLELLVRKRAYLSEAELIELQALCTILPGPTSTQTLTAIAFKIGGPNLAYLTLFVWIAPAVTFMTTIALSVSYLERQGISLNFARFLEPVAVGLVIHGGYQIAHKVLRNASGLGLALVACLVAYLIRSPFVAPVIVLLGGIITAVEYRKLERKETKVPLKIEWSNFVLFLSVPVLAAVAGGISHWLPIRLFENFYRNGSLIFGGGDVLLPLLFTEFVQFKGYLTQDEFLPGLALARVVPGPVFAFTAFIGVLSMREYGLGGQLLGSLMATAGIFLPGTFMIFFVYRFWDQLKQYRIVRASLEGITAAGIGLIAASALILLQSMHTEPINYLIVVISFLLLQYTKIPQPFLILGALLAGFLL